MDGLGWALGTGPHGIIGLALLLLVAAAVVRLLGHLWRPAATLPATPEGSRPGGRAPALAALELRHARGDVEREEYLQKRQDLI